MKHAGKIIADRVTELGWTKAEFGRRIGITQRQNVQRLLEKEEFTLPELQQYGEVLDMDLIAAVYPESIGHGAVAEEQPKAYLTRMIPSVTVQLDGTREQLKKTIKMLEKMNEAVRMTAV